MLLRSVALLATLTAAIPVIAQNISAADIASSIGQLTTLTRIATSFTQDVVFVNNPPVVRKGVIGIIDAIGTQANLCKNSITGDAYGALTKKRATFSPKEQEDVADAYIIVRLPTYILYYSLPFNPTLP